MEIKQSLQKLEEKMRLRNYSAKTIKSYISCLHDFLNQKDLNLVDFDLTMIEQYLLSKKDKGSSPQTINLYLNAIKYFYQEFFNQRINLKFSKRSLKLPVVLAREEIEKLLNSLSNAKHRLMLALSYGAGLRVSEVVALKVVDIDFARQVITVREGKGKKDRQTILPEKLINDLRNQIAGKIGSENIFESQRGGRLTTRTAQAVFEQALKKSGIQKSATFHSLRHSFATQLLENGVDIRYIQELLGHQNIRTTQIYTKVTNNAIRNIKSPL